MTILSGAETIPIQATSLINLNSDASLSRDDFYDLLVCHSCYHISIAICCRQEPPSKKNSASFFQHSISWPFRWRSWCFTDRYCWIYSLLCWTLSKSNCIVFCNYCQRDSINLVQIHKFSFPRAHRSLQSLRCCPALTFFKIQFHSFIPLHPKLKPGFCLNFAVIRL